MKKSIGLLLTLAIIVTSFTSIFAASDITSNDLASNTYNTSAAELNSNTNSDDINIYKDYEKRDPNSKGIDSSNLEVIPSSFDLLNGTAKDPANLIRTLTTMVTGGYELPYNPNYWNSADIINKANCYAYALNVYVNIPNYKLQPGEVSGNTVSLNESSIFACMQADLRSLGRTCRRSYYSEVPGYREYKIAMVIAPGTDYHFYRQDSDAGWSHKRGLTAIDFRDASLQSIYDPSVCNRNYGAPLNYSLWGNYYIISY